jgi:RecB family exonuclease
MEQMLHEGLIGDTYKATFIETLQQMLRHPELSSLLDEEGEVLNEAEILSAEGKSYRPDRVTLTAKGVTLIDYKTGEPLASHKDQIDHYGKLLNEMGYAGIKKALVYIGDQVQIEFV